MQDKGKCGHANAVKVETRPGGTFQGKLLNFYTFRCPDCEARILENNSEREP